MARTSSGLWVPDSSFPSNKFTAADVKKDRRIYLGGKGPYESLGFRYDTVGHWQSHGRGRLDSFPDVMTKIAVLRSRGKINDSEIIACTGVYQDFRGAPQHYQRAHRFPCNPWIGVFTLPEVGFRLSTNIWAEMCRPLAATDIVPNYINYGDSCIEKSGMYDVVREAVKEVVLEQRNGKPINPRLIEHVVRYGLIPGLKQALERALVSVREESDESFADLMQGEQPFSAKALRSMEHASLTAEFNPAKPTLALQSVEDYLWLSLRDIDTYQPSTLHPANVLSEIARLESMSEV